MKFVKTTDDLLKAIKRLESDVSKALAESRRAEDELQHEDSRDPSSSSIPALRHVAEGAAMEYEIAEERLRSARRLLKFDFPSLCQFLRHVRRHHSWPVQERIEQWLADGFSLSSADDDASELIRLQNEHAFDRKPRRQAA